MRSRKRSGECLLTGQQGPLVKCHIIPQAFTKPTIAGAPLLQSTQGKGHRRRWSSWYDNSLVTRSGEDILSEIDNAAIKELRRYKLVWSGWGIAPPVFESLSFLSPNHGCRKLNGLDQSTLSLFFLSIAWRASVATIKDFEDVKLSCHLEDLLREIILSRTIPDNSFRISLMQLSTRGEQHNQSPYLDEKLVPSLSSSKPTRIKIVRIYVDGLIAHVHLSDDEEIEQGNDKISVFLGEADSILVPSVTYEASFQYENLLTLAYESYLGPVA